MSRHLRRDTNEVFIKTKGDVEAWVAVPAETMKLIPETRPGDYVWRTAAGAKLRRETPYTVFRKCLADAGIPDPELYDSHSLRRRWITSATEDGIPLPITMAQALHTDVKHHMGYRRNAAAPSTHDAVERVRGRRVAALARLETKRGIPDSSRIWDASPESSGLVAAGNAGSYDLTSEMHDSATTMRGGAASKKAEREATRHDEHIDARTRITPGGRQDRAVARLSRWAAEDPAAMLGLLDDPELQAHLRSALAKQCLAEDPAERRIDSA